jgi:hypothetical protein
MVGFAPQAYYATCMVCEPWDHVWALNIAVYASAALLGAWLLVAGFHINRREFWWLASPPYALAGGLVVSQIATGILGWFLATH